MKEFAQKKIVDLFARNNHLESKNIPTKVKAVIAHSVAPFYLFVECLEPSGLSASNNIVDGILITMLTRLFNVVSGALTLLSLGQLQQAEILSRTIMESSINLLYITKGNSDVKLIQYFDSYIKQEYVQNKKWFKELSGLPNSDSADHALRIQNKEHYLSKTEVFIKHIADSLNVKYPCEKGLPKLVDMCAELNKAIDYRTVYAAMCSQSHHDAEDILNDLMVGTSPNEEQLSEEINSEINNFSIFLVLLSIRYSLECLGEMGIKYKLTSVIDQTSKSHASISELAQLVSSDGKGFIGNSLDEWILNET